MANGPVLAFSWFTPLGISVALFLLSSLFTAAIALLSTVLLRIFADQAPHFVFSAGVDEAIIGRNPGEISREMPGLRSLLFAWANLAMGLMVAAAAVEAAVAWYGLRAGQPWALWTLLAGNLVAIGYYWLLIVLPFARQTRVRIADLHPFLLVPTVLAPAAFVIGLFAFR